MQRNKRDKMRLAPPRRQTEWDGGEVQGEPLEWLSNVGDVLGVE